MRDFDAIVITPKNSDPLLTALAAEGALIPLAGLPMIARAIEALVSLGRRHIALVLPAWGQAARSALQDGARWGCRITYLPEGQANAPYQLLASLMPRHGMLTLATAHTLITPPDTHDAWAAWHLDGGRPRLSGWAQLSANALAEAAECATDATDLIHRAAAHAPLATTPLTLSCHSAHATLEATRHLLNHPQLARNLPRRPATAGAWIAPGAAIHPTARLHPPLFIGKGSVVRAHASIGPHTLIGEGCCIDHSAHIANSLIMPNTYLGAALSLSDAIANGQRLASIAHRSVLHLDDPELLGRIGAAS